MKIFGEDSPIEFIHPDEMAFGSVSEESISNPVDTLDQG